MRIGRVLSINRRGGVGGRPAGRLDARPLRPCERLSQYCAKPSPAKPTSTIAQVEGSGTVARVAAKDAAALPPAYP